MPSRKKDSTQIPAAEIKILQSVRYCTRQGRITNEQIRVNLGVHNMNDKIMNVSQDGNNTSTEWTDEDYQRLKWITNYGKTRYWTTRWFW